MAADTLKRPGAANPPSRGAIIARAIARNLALSGVLIAVSAVIAAVSPALATLVMLVFSAWMMLRSYRREWPLQWLTCLLPGVTALGCYVAQAVLFDRYQSGPLLLGGIVVGLVLGVLSGRGHRVFTKGSQVFARRTSIYLLVWIATVVLTQGAAILGIRSALSVLLSGGAFSTSMVVVVSVMLFSKYRSMRQRPAPLPGMAAAVLIGAVMTGWATALVAAAPERPQVPASAAFTLPDGIVGAPYSYTVTVTTPAPSWEWMLVDGALPDGLQLAPSGTISGTPDAAGTFRFTLRVTDSEGRSGGQSYSITIGRQSTPTPEAPPATRAAAGGMDIYEIASRLVRQDELPAQIVITNMTSAENKAKATEYFASHLPQGFAQLELPKPDDVGLFLAQTNPYRDSFGLVALLVIHFTDGQASRAFADALDNAAQRMARPGEDIVRNGLGCGDRSLSGYDPVSVGGTSMAFVFTGEWGLFVAVGLPNSLYLPDPGDANNQEKIAAANPRIKADTIQLRDRVTCLAVQRLGEMHYAGAANAIPGVASGTTGPSGPDAPPVTMFDLVDRLRQLIGGTTGGALEDAAVDAGLLSALMLLFSGATLNTAISVATTVAAAAQRAAETAALAAQQAAATAAAEAATLPPLIDPETAQPLPFNDGSQPGGRAGQVLYRDRWMDRGEAERQLAEWEANYQAERSRAFDRQAEEWEQSVADKRARDGYEYDAFTQAYRKPPEFEPLPLPAENGAAAAPDLEAGWFSYGASDTSLRNRLDEWEARERDALDRYRDLNDRIEKATRAGDRWLADQLRANLDAARQNVRDIQRGKNVLVDRVDQMERGARGVQRGIDQVTVGDTWRETKRMPGEMLDAFVNDPDFIQTMKAAIAARNRLQQDMDLSPELCRQHDDAMQQLRGLAARIKAARDAGDVQGERALRAQAEPVKVSLRQVQDRLNQLQRDNVQWQRQASLANLSAYRKATDMVGAGTQTPGMAGAVNGAIDFFRRRHMPGAVSTPDSGWSFRKPNEPGFVGLKDTGWSYRNPTEPGWVGQKDTGWSYRDVARDGRTLAERALDKEHFVNAAEGRARVSQWDAVQKAGEADRRAATLACLEDRQAKLLQKDREGLLPPSVKNRWYQEVDQFRNQPLFREMARESNARGYGTVEGSRTRPVERTDYDPVSGPASQGPGQDLDIKHAQIVDLNTGKPVTFRELQNVAETACKNLGFDPVKQEIQVIGGTHGSTHPAAFPIARGATAETMYEPQNLARLDKYQVGQATNLSDFKGAQAAVEHGPAGALSEACRGAMKDYGRVTKPLMDVHPDAKLPVPLSEDALKVMKQVGDGTLPPGTGNNRFRQLTGMDLQDGWRKMNSLQESVVKLDSSQPRMPPPASSAQPVAAAPATVPSAPAAPAPAPLPGTPDYSRWSTKAEFERMGRELAGSTPAQQAHTAELQAWADQIRRGERIVWPERQLPGAQGWPAVSTDRQQWPQGLGTIQAGTMKPEAAGGDWWPKDSTGKPFESTMWPKGTPTEQERWIARDVEKGLPAPSADDPYVVMGARRSPELDRMLSDNPQLHNLKELDDKIRSAWYDSGVMAAEDHPDPWGQFVKNLDDRGIDPTRFDEWSRQIRALQSGASIAAPRATFAQRSAEFARPD